MYVKLISLTQTYIPGPGTGTTEDLIVYCARISSPENQENTETAPKLLRYLIRKGHWSPFDMVDMTVELETSRAIAAQILRHWSFSFQEFSQRYAKASLGYEAVTPRRQGATNRQSSTDDLGGETSAWFRETLEDLQARATMEYNTALAKGVAREQARFLLPLSTKTRMYMKGSVRDWIHYLRARCADDAQQEHREVAEAIRAIFTEHFPNVAAAMAEKEPNP